IGAPDTCVRDLRVLSDESRAALVAMSTGQLAADTDVLLHELVERQAATTPDAIALVDGERTLSYRALDTTAARWASVLRERGVQPDTLVGVALERGFDLITAYLAILKAGAAFAPLDPAYPRARLLTMFERAGAPFVIATDQMARDLELGERAVQVDDLRASRGRARARTVPTSAAAYGIFTSGSTGEPNCVIVPHAAIVNTLTWRQRWMPLGRGDRVLQTMS